MLDLTWVHPFPKRGSSLIEKGLSLLKKKGFDPFFEKGLTPVGKEINQFYNLIGFSPFLKDIHLCYKRGWPNFLKGSATLEKEINRLILFLIKVNPFQKWEQPPF